MTFLRGGKGEELTTFEDLWKMSRVKMLLNKSCDFCLMRLTAVVVYFCTLSNGIAHNRQSLSDLSVAAIA